MSFPPPICNRWIRCNLARFAGSGLSTPGARWRVVLPFGKTPRPLCAATLARLADSPCLYSSPLDAARSKDAARSRRNGLGLLAAVQDPAERWAFRRKAGLNARPCSRRRSSRLPSAFRSPVSAVSFSAPKRGGLGPRAPLSSNPVLPSGFFFGD